MAITRSQQARQMLKTAGAVVQDGSLNFIKDSKSVTVPKEFKARKNAPATKLAYITDAEAKMLKKKKPGTPHKGPKGIPSYDSYGSIVDGKDVGVSGVATSAAETGSRDPRDIREMQAQFNTANLGPGVIPEQAKDYRSAFIAAGGGQRVNPSFFDSRDTVSPEELRRAKQFAPKAFARNRRGGILGFLTSGGILGNLLRNIGQRFGLGKTYDEPTYDMSEFNKLGLFGQVPEDFKDDPKISNISFTANDPNNLLNQNIIIPKRKPDTQGLLEVPGIPTTPFQKDVIEDTQDQADDLFLQGAMADALTTPTEGKFGVSLSDYTKLRNEGFNDRQIQELQLNPKIDVKEVIRDIEGPIFAAADGGMIGGGIMDAAGRQQYFLGKLVKKATRAVKKIVKSPVGRLGLGALALKFGLPAGAKSSIMDFLFKEGTLGSGLTGGGKFALGAGISALPLLFGQQEEEQPSGFTGSVGGKIDPRAYTDPFSVLYGAFKAEGGSMKDEPVAKRTMPLLDMGGQEMDLRAEGGFVPIGRMEKADDVPARLSKNEFVFTADAVRNAGDGDVDKGAEVMYNMMKNLEAGGEVSEESQGLEGARNMFQTSKRLEEVL